MSVLRRVLRRFSAGAASVALAVGLLAVAATPAEAAWRQAWNGAYPNQSTCEAARAAHEASISPSEGGVADHCTYYSYDPQNRNRGAGWYYYFIYSTN